MGKKPYVPMTPEGAARLDERLSHKIAKPVAKVPSVGKRFKKARKP